MKLNIAYPATGCQKVLDVDDDRKLRAFFDKRISAEVEGEALGDDFKGYIFKITGGNDKEGFAMQQGVLTASRVRLLLAEGSPGYRARKRGERKRKSVRGCIVSGELSVLNLVVVKKGDAEIPGLTDTIKPRRLGPKRASRIRKLFNLEAKDDVRKFVIRRQIVKESKKPYFKAPKIQRLVTPQRLQRKREFKAIRRERYESSKAQAEEYNKLLSLRFKEAKDKRATRVASKRLSEAKGTDAPKKPAEKPAKKESKKESKKEAPKTAPKEKAAPKTDAPKPAKKEEKKAEPKKAKAEGKKAPKAPKTEKPKA
jgi:small subunit ribosomal protein S6e